MNTEKWRMIWQEVDETARLARLVGRNSTVDPVPALLVLALNSPLEGVSCSGCLLTIVVTGDLFDTQMTAHPRSACERLENFSVDFAELKPGDHVVHVDHGITVKEAASTLQTDSAVKMGEFMLLPVMGMTRDFMCRWLAWIWCRRIARWDVEVQLDKLSGTAGESRRAKAKVTEGHGGSTGFVFMRSKENFRERTRFLRHSWQRTGDAFDPERRRKIKTRGRSWI